MKRLLCMLLAAVMLMTAVPVVVVPAQAEPSDWAAAEVAAAKANGLVTDSLTADYGKDVSREEFCELAVKLYEKITGINLKPAPEIFKDTTNPEILKAYNAGIVKGVSSIYFDPYSAVTRQEICVMMTRCIERAIPSSTVYKYNINTFADSELISDWAFAEVNYSFDHGVIHGIGADYLDPLGTVTSEAAIVLVNRMYENRNSYVGETVETKASVKLDSPDGAVTSVDVACNSPYGLGGIVASDVTEYDGYTAGAAGSLGQVIHISGKYGMNTIKSADITMKYDPSELNGTEESSLGVARYDESLGRMVLMPEVTVDAAADTVSFTDSALGGYVMVDEEKWYEEWRQAQTEVRDNTAAEDTAAYFDVVFLVDDSGSMVDNDPDKVRATAVYNFIRSLAPGDGFEVIHFTDSNSVNTEYTRVADVSDWGALQKQLSSLGSNGGTDISGAVSGGISALDAVERGTEKIMVLLTDGKQDTKGSDYDENIIHEAAGRGYKIHTVSLGADTDAEVLRSIADITGGSYYTSDRAEELIGVYKEIKGENIGWDGDDNDNDSLADIIESRGMRNQYGIFIKTDPLKFDTDSDSLGDGSEMGEKVIDDKNVSVKDIQNGVTAYVYYIMKSDPNFKDSDNDGIPDADDAFPLNSDKVSWEEAVGIEDRTLDTNEDGISDYYTELIYQGQLLTTDGKSFEGYHFGVNPDYDGDGLKNGAELIITEADNRIYMQMVSDPTLINSDGDKYDDHQELEVYGTDPLGVSLTNSELEYATNSDMFLAHGYRDYLNSSESAQTALIYANFIQGSNYDQIPIYKDALIKMFDNIREADEESKTVDNAVAVMNDVTDSLKSAIRAAEATDIENAPDKILELEEEYGKLLELQRSALKAKDVETVEKLTHELIDISDNIDKQNNIIEKAKDVPIDIPSVSGRITAAIKVVDVLSDGYEFIGSMASLQANAGIINDNIYILSKLEGAQNPMLAAAAAELKLAAQNSLGSILSPLRDLAGDKLTSAGVDALVAAAGKAASSASVLWVTALAGAVDAVMGVSETGGEAVKTLVMAETAELLREEVLYSFDKDTALFNSLDTDKLKLYTNLLAARKAGEQFYSDLRDLTLAARITVGWAVGDAAEAKRLAKDNIDRCDELIELYSPDAIKRRRI